MGSGTNRSRRNIEEVAKNNLFSCSGFILQYDLGGTKNIKAVVTARSPIQLQFVKISRDDLLRFGPLAAL